MIVNAPRADRIHGSLNFRLDNVQSMPINESGLLVRFFIAAKFNYTISSGWPVLQIRRRINSTLSFVTLISTTKEPRPTEYLNVFEYNVQAMAFELQHRDVIRPLNTVGSRSCYSLAYFRGNSDVMMSIDVQHHIQTVTTLSMGDNNLFNGISTDRTSNSELILTTKPSLSQKEQSESTVTIIGSIIICTIIVLVVLLVIVGITVTVLIYRHKNSTEHSLVAADHADSSDIELDSNMAYITCFQAKEEQQGTDTTECTGVDANILTEPNLAYGTLKANDYDYVVVPSLT